MRRCKLTYHVVILIYAIVYVYLYQGTCPTLKTILILAFWEREKYILWKNLLKGISGKAKNTTKIILLLEKRHHVEISKRSFNSLRDVPLDLDYLKKNLHIYFVSLLEDLQQYLEENGSSHGYRNLQERLMSRGI